MRACREGPTREGHKVNVPKLVWSPRLSVIVVPTHIFHRDADAVLPFSGAVGYLFMFVSCLVVSSLPPRTDCSSPNSAHPLVIFFFY